MRTQKILALVLALCLAAGLTACGGADDAGYAPPAYDGSAPSETPYAPPAAEDSGWYGCEPEIPAYDQWNSEEYAPIRENGFLSVSAAPLSTFAADVDTASYANLRRMLLDGGTVSADAVRVEEMVNYFRYDYPEPREGEPFSVTTEVVPCPWNSGSLLFKAGLQTAQPDWESMPPSNLVFLIDVSGSMDEADKLPLVQQAFLLLTEHLAQDDTISIVTYASGDAMVLDGARGSERARIQAAIEDLTAGGSTNGSRGIESAYRLAEAHFIPGGNNRVILATDGDVNVGLTSEDQLKALIREKKESGVFLSVMGFGAGNLKDSKLELLADCGNGNYAYIDSVLEAKRALVEEMGGTLFTVAKDVKLQVEFNPARVEAYRLVGYENRTMAAQDFADDRKDGGEVGAGHRVTVLYELVPAASALPLKYQETPAAPSGDYLTVSVRYKAPDGAESRLLEYPVADESWRTAPTPDTAFAACVAEFGMLLRGSDYAGSATYQQVVETLTGLPGIAGDPDRAEFLYLVQQCARRF